MLSCCAFPSSPSCLSPFLYYLGKIVLNQLSIYSGGRGRYFVSNVLRDSWGFGGNVAYTFLLKASGSKFLLQVFFLSSGFFFFPSSAPIVHFLSDVTPQKSFLSILCHFPQAIFSQKPQTHQSCVYTRVY